MCDETGALLIVDEVQTGFGRTGRFLACEHHDLRPDLLCIGKAMAGRIVAFRDEHGPFKRVEDLMKIKGIGEKSFEKIRPYVKVSKTR